MSVNVLPMPFLDFRVNVKASIETLPSEAKFPFYSQAFLVPKSKVAEYLNGDFELNKYYKIKQADYSTKAKGEFLKGMTTFYNQPHTQSEAGVVVFEDSFAEDPDNPTTMTDYINAKEENRLASITRAFNAIGRNAIAVGVAIDDVKFYEMAMDDFRQIDTLISKLKIKVKNSLATTKDEKAKLQADYQKYGGTILCWQKNEAFADTNKTISFEYRADFIIGGAGLNPFIRQGDSYIYPVGMNWDGLSVNIPVANIEYNTTATKDDMQDLTDMDISYFEVRADDDSEILITGCGVYYQGQSIPASMFLLAKYSEYILQTSIFDEIMKEKSGVASVMVYRRALSTAKASLDPFVGFLLASLTMQNYTQSELNSLVVDKTLKLTNCLSLTTLRVTKFTEASISVLVQ